MIDFQTSVQGVPCIVVVTDHCYNRPDPYADASEDYLGGWELDWHLCDMRGAPAPWLEAKLTDEDRQRVEYEIIEELT